MSTYRKKLIEVAMPLDAINAASAREKSIRHGHPSTLHLWWARRPLAACRAVLFGQLVDDPSAWPDRFPTEAEQDAERQRLFGLLEELVKWESSNDEVVLDAARLEIARSHARGRLADGEGDERDEAVLKKGVDPATVRAYLAEVLPPVHDPFAGGGSIPLEAQRLGLRAIATDLNPVAVLINKALIEIPPRFAGRPPVFGRSEWRGVRKERGSDALSGDGTPAPLSKPVAPLTPHSSSLFPPQWPGATGLAEDVRRYGAWMREEALRRIGHLYPKVKVTEAMAAGRPDLQPYVGQERTVIAWLWARTVRCPNPGCGAEMPLVRSFALSTKKGKETWGEPVVDGADYRFEVRTGPGKPPEGTVSRSGARCICCQTPVPFEHVRAEGKAGRMGARMMAIVAEGDRSRIYLPPTEEMEAVAASAEPWFAPDGEISHWPGRTNVVEYGLTTFGNLFTPRQLVALTTFSDLVREAREKAIADARAAGWEDDGRGLEAGGTGATAYGDVVAVYLAFLLDKTADRNNALCSWDSGPAGTRASTGGSARTASLRNLFSRQAIPMVWDYGEANPFSDSGGGFLSSLSWIEPALRSLRGSTVAHAFIEDAANPQPAPPHVISTDPPYYDNISYADLSDFFYVWLRRSLRPVYPKLFRTMLVPKASELIASPYRHGGKEQAEAFFLEGMTRAIRAMARATPADTPVTIYYAFKQAELKKEGLFSTGWETFLGAVLEAGFSVTGTWPVRTELSNRMIAKGTNALASSIVLVCRKRPEDAPTITRGQLRRLLKQELPAALEQLQKGHIAPVDLAQASIGPGMAVFSRHARVLEADGAPMTVRGALQLIHQVMDEIRGEAEGEFDRDTRFAVTWFESHGFEPGPYGDAETLAKARAVSVAGVQEAGILRSAAGRVRLLRREELPADWDPRTDGRPTVWEATQHLVKRLDEAGESGAAALLGRLGATAEQARDLAYRLYTICERKGWAEEARAYNGLLVAWPELEKLARRPATADGAAAQPGLFE